MHKVTLIVVASLVAFYSAYAEESESPQQTPEPPPAENPAPADEQNTLTTLVILAKGSGRPLSKAEVKIGTSLLYANDKGEVQVDIPPAGDGTLTIQRKGYLKEDIAFNSLRPVGVYEIFLYPNVPDDDVVIVRGSRKPAISRKIVSIEEAAKVAPGGDPAQVVKLLPGVQASAFGGEAVIRGSGPRNSNYYVDDLAVPFIFHFANLSLIPGSLLSSVDFESGGFGPEYGDATGGVVVLRTTNEIPERPRTEFVVNLPIYSGILHTRPLSESSSLTVSVRRSYLDLFIQGIVDQQTEKADAPSVTVVPYFGDMHVVYLTKDDTGHTKYSLLGAYDGIRLVAPHDMASNEEGTISAKTYFGFINLGVERLTRLSDGWRMTTTPQVSYFDQDSDFFGNKIAISFTQFRAPTEFVKRLSAKEDLTLGFDPAVGRAEADVYSIRPRLDDPSFDPEDEPKTRAVLKENLSTLAAWAAQDFDLGGMVVTPGVRAFYNQQLTRAGVDPRLRARIALNENHSLKGAVGQYSENPNPEEASKDWGNPNLDFTKAYHYVLGIESRWSDLWQTDFQVFYKNAVDIVRNDPVKNYSNNGSLRSKGVEVFLRRNLTGRLFGWLSYTYSETEEQEAPGEPFVRADYDQTHVVNLVGNYKLTGTWDLGGRFNYHSGDVYSKVSSAVYNADLDKYQPRRSESDNNGGRLPDYKSLTIYAQHDFLFDRWKMALRFGLESYWFQPQTSFVQYNYDYSKEEEIRGITSIPFLELQGEI